ncbi:MAG: flagellar basal body rod protein FlgB [Burkholderiales bacterium]|nr:flagellar basal body rod protein FlgB [Burkholderiales bacterium]PZN03995.1 MAG: flagellar basal body rod protein FlgB [Pseudomonadota bacterium]
MTTGKLDQLLHLQSEALKLRARRQEVIASNLANADTPHYKAVDFNFAEALRKATGAAGSTGGAPALLKTNPNHIGPDRSTLSTVKLLYRTPTQASVDGNTVEMHIEQANFADNAVRYEASLRFLNGQIKTMLSAIQD